MMKTTAQDIMSTELLTVQEGSSLEEALKILLNNKITGLPVVDKTNLLVGVVSEYDIMLQISQTANIEKTDLTVPFHFSRTVDCISTTTSLEEIIDIFITKKYRRVLVQDDKKKLTGIITRRDLMKLFYYRARLG
jgi:CBS domain-containing protein